jgi:protein O-GlcNAc transferase
MYKIISFCLWGDDPKYTIGAIKNAMLAKDIYPGWICRFYLGRSVPEKIKKELIGFDNTHIIEMKEEGNWTGMFWRFYPASEPDVDIMISRDTDSRLNMREKHAVDEWLSGDKNFHIMRDHPYHGTKILGGMWGVRSGLLKDMKEMIINYTKGDYWQVDQNFLKEIIFPLIKNNVCVHDPFFDKKDFPYPRNGYEFVGQIFDENEETVEEHLKALQEALK